MKRKKIVAWFCALSIVCGCTLPTVENKAESGKEFITVTDSEGRLVQVPQNPQSICCICPFAGPLAVMFDKGEQITSICNNMDRSKLLKKIYPGISEAPVAKAGGSVNAETILELKTDLILVNSETWNEEAERKKLEILGIPCVVIGFENIEEQMEAIETVGAVLGADEEAKAYLDWYKEIILEVSETSADIPKEERPSLYHAVNESLRTDYEGSICAEWIAYTGAENVSLESDNLSLEGDKAYTTLEQIYEWSPDLIICNEPGIDDFILKDDKWAGLSSVQSKKVYQIPVGISRMGHPTSTETPLAILWLAETLYPERFDIDYNQEVYDYYKNFFDLELTEAEISNIIHADKMRTGKTGTTGGKK